MDALVQQYARLVPLAHLQPPSASPWTFRCAHDVLLNKILLDPHLRTYTPALEYQLRFWKWAIQKLEALVCDQVGLQDPHRAAFRDPLRTSKKLTAEYMNI